MDLKVSKDIELYLYAVKDGESFEEKANLSLIVGLFSLKMVTLEKAAELSGKNVWEFIDILKRYQIPWGEYTEESAEIDEIALSKIREGSLK